MTSESSDVMTSQDTGGAGFPGARAAARSAGRVRSLRWLPASPGRNARGWGATGGGSCVLDVGRAFVQYAQPLASRSPPSWSRPSRKRRTGRAALRRCHRDPGQGPGGADGDRGARPHHQDPVESLPPAARCPLSGHQRAGRRCSQRGSLEFCDCSSGFDVGAELMSAPWAPTTHRLSFIDPPSSPGQPPHPGFPPERASQK